MCFGIRVLLYSEFLSGVVIGLFLPVYYLFIEQIGGDPVDSGIGFGVYSLVNGVFTLGLGRFGNKLNKKALVVSGYLFLCLGTAGYLLIRTPLHFIIVQGILGVGVGMSNVCSSALYSIWMEKGKETAVWGYNMGGFEIIFTFAAVLGGWMVKNFGFRDVFLLMLAVQLASLLFAWKVLKTDDKGRKTRLLGG